MLTNLKQRFGHDDEQGFTLIELMVVVLIIAILLAIAIPTFLGARNSANARSMQSNLRNALTAEQTNWTNTQGMSQNLSTIEPSLNWAAAEAAITAKGGNTIFAILEVPAAPVAPAQSQGVVLQGLASDGNCYMIFASDDASTATSSFTSYSATAGVCQAPTPANLPQAKAAAAMLGVVQASTLIPVWYTAW